MIQQNDEPLPQRVLRIVEKFHERTANEPNPLSRARIREVIQQVVTEREEERRREA